MIDHARTQRAVVVTECCRELILQRRRTRRPAASDASVTTKNLKEYRFSLIIRRPRTVDQHCGGKRYTLRKVSTSEHVLERDTIINEIIPILASVFCNSVILYFVFCVL